MTTTHDTAPTVVGEEGAAVKGKPTILATGIYATAVEREEIRNLINQAARTPAILVGNVNLSHAAWDQVHQRVTEHALSHGLPDTKDDYGYGFNMHGEFTRLAEGGTT